MMQQNQHLFGSLLCGANFLSFYFSCGIFLPLNSSSFPFLEWTQTGGLKFVELNTTICYSAFHAGANSVVHLVIHSLLTY